MVLFGILDLGATQTHIHFTLSGPRVFFGHLKSGLAEEDEVDLTAKNVIASSVKHDLKLLSLKWADQTLFRKVGFGSRLVREQPRRAQFPYYLYQLFKSHQPD